MLHPLTMLRSFTTDRATPPYKACAGGPLHGNASCVTGHHGNFCAQCWQGWFRGTSSCRKCPQDTSHAAAVAVSMVAVTGIGMLIAA